MHLVVIGGGVVGSATALGFQRLGHTVRVVDPKPDCLAAQRGLAVSPDWLKGSIDFVFICVPERAVDQAADLACEAPIPYGTPVFIRSSVPPGTCRRLSVQQSRPFGHNPEFLRAAVAEYEFLNPPGVIIGVDGPDIRHGQELQALYEPLRVPIHVTNTLTSELLKLTVNSYLASQVSFWNTIKDVADAIGVNSHEVGMLASHCDDRVSVYGARMHGEPYGGTCLPKDLQQVLDLAEQKQVFVPLLRAVKEVNDAVARRPIGAAR